MKDLVANWRQIVECPSCGNTACVEFDGEPAERRTYSAPGSPARTWVHRLERSCNGTCTATDAEIGSIALDLSTEGVTWR